MTEWTDTPCPEPLSRAVANSLSRQEARATGVVAVAWVPPKDGVWQCITCKRRFHTLRAIAHHLPDDECSGPATVSLVKQATGPSPRATLVFHSWGVRETVYDLQDPCGCTWTRSPLITTGQHARLGTCEFHLAAAHLRNAMAVSA